MLQSFSIGQTRLQHSHNTSIPDRQVLKMKLLRVFEYGSSGTSGNVSCCFCVLLHEDEVVDDDDTFLRSK
jgi:hypothetical protein